MRPGEPASSDVTSLARLDDRVAVVTGGCGLVGRAVVDALAELGARVAIVDIDGDACADDAEQLAARRGVPAVGLATDLGDEAQARTVAARAIDAFGRIDVLVHLAALTTDLGLDGYAGPFEQQGLGSWRRALDVNLTAAFIVTQACAPALRASGHGSVILTGSIYGVVGPDWSIYDGTDLGNSAAYAASKGGVLQLMRWLATTLAPEVRVNAVTPGGLERSQPDAFRAAYARRTPLGRMGTAADLKGAMAYLAGDLSGYVTGHNLVVDGGWTAW